jgi:beta-aspartyl-peptidase (threonine type)
MKPSLIVHGGAWDIPDEAVPACEAGCREALAAGWSILSRGGSALDAVEAAIVVLEDDPVFDAGFGSHLNLDGRVECDAIVMNGATLRAGAVAGLQRVRNPIRLARAVLEHCPHMMLVAEGAERFANDAGIALCDPAELVSNAEREAWRVCSQDKHAAMHHRGHEQGTVGAVALDRNGKLFAATSTGGTCCKLPGRVGDSPLIGCGCYADSTAGGVSCTGYGEAIMKIVMAKTATELLRPGNGGFCVSESSRDASGKLSHSCAADTAMHVAREAVHLLAKRTHATGGLILLDCEGNPGFAFNTPRMAYGYLAADGSMCIAV